MVATLLLSRASLSIHHTLFIHVACLDLHTNHPVNISALECCCLYGQHCSVACLASRQDAILSIVTAQMVFMSFTGGSGDIVCGPALPQLNHTSSESTCKISTAAVQSAIVLSVLSAAYNSYCRLHFSWRLIP